MRTTRDIRQWFSSMATPDVWVLRLVRRLPPLREQTESNETHACNEHIPALIVGNEFQFRDLTQIANERKIANSLSVRQSGFNECLGLFVSVEIRIGQQEPTYRYKSRLDE